ncbi:S8 family serine peptidase [Kribbella sp. NBC_01484]|uniref:S8 family serine peptidase n=1 Tax=Kribbella sp. NBC_01484 TaxID=2903579 RepID=UPI002E333EBD|nr:S8 family serine peptidase [Kribbella sp. NBC_01484]
MPFSPPLRRRLRSILIGVMSPVLLAVSAVNVPAARAVQPDKLEPKLAVRLADGRSDFWVRFERQPELTSAARVADWTERGKAVVSALRAKADDDQAGATKLLRAAKTDYIPLYIDNSIYVRNGSRELAAKLAADPKVVSLRTPTTYALPEPQVEPKAAVTAGVEWGVSAIHADQVWSRYHATGQGVVVGSIDSGAQYDHPALVSSYRGANGDGTFDHDYNWYDPGHACGTDAPCDNVGHGTHTIGTMVGDDHAGHQVGVAPGARWISAKGCATDGCDDLTLALSAQWMLAPTKLDGSDPDPSKRPNIINNSWSSPARDPWFEEWVRQWVAAGIFTTYSAGNNGPACSTVGSPGDYPEAYAVGAVDNKGAVASYSSRGNPAVEGIKPDIVAPGQMILSSVPGDRYAYYSGTSMAAPHLSGAVALLWSAAPALIGDVTATRAVLDRTAHDHDDLSCGGTAADNNVYGEGMLDVAAAVSGSPRPDAGLLTGTVTDSGGKPIAGISLSAPDSNVVTTDAAGRYQLYLDAGDHDVTAQGFGYDTEVFTVQVEKQTTITKDLQLAVTPRATLSGLVRDGSGHGWPLYARLRIEGVPGVWFTKPATGRYTIDLPVGTTHKLKVEPVYGGYTSTTVDVKLTDDLVQDVAVPIDTQTCKALGYDAQCNKERGGLVEGLVTDANTKQPVNGATLTRAGQTATTVTTPDDPALPDGFYWLFAPVGAERVAATMHGYQQQTKPVTVQTDWAKPLNFSLPAGLLTVRQSAVDVTVELGKSAQRELTITNEGTAPASYSLADVQRGFELQGAGRTAGFGRTTAGTPVRREPIHPEPGHTLGGAATRGGAQVAPKQSVAGLWMPTANYPVAVSDNAVASQDGLVYSVGGLAAGQVAAASYVYDPSTLQWQRFADMPESRRKAASGFVDGKLYVVGGWGPQDLAAAATLIYDPAADRWSTGAANPKPWGAVGSAVLDGKVYSVGGCAGECQSSTTDVLAYDVAHNKFDTVAPYPESISWPSCGGIDGKVYCAGGLGMDSSGTGPQSTAHSYVYDPGTNTWTRVADLPLDLWASSYTVANGVLAVTGGVAVDSTVLTNEAFAYSPRTDHWTALPNTTNALYRGAAACGLYRVGGLHDARQVPYSEVLPGYDQCAEDGTDAAWLTESVGSGTLAPKASATITLTADSATLSQPGIYRSALSVRDDTPYAGPSVDVTLTARAPANWARLSGTVTGRSCTGEATPLPGATVAIDRRTDSWTLTSGMDGGYAVWVRGAGVKARVVVAAPDFRPASVDVVLRPGSSTVLPVTLQALHC